jgi:uncharacterized protein YneR
MATRVELIVLCEPGAAIGDLLRAVADEALPDADVRSVERFRRAMGGTPLEICGVNVELDDEVGVSSEDVLQLGIALQAADGIVHVTKLYDDVLLRRREQWVAELFEIEMRLREALSIVLIEACGGATELLKDVSVGVMPDAPRGEELQSRLENELFYLSFADYPRLNNRRQPKSVADLIEVVLDAEDYAAMRESLRASVTTNEAHADFVVRLRALMDPVERMRNAVAHNRDVSERLVGNYEMARRGLLEAVDEFMAAV